MLLKALFCGLATFIITIDAACYGPGTVGDLNSYGWEGQQAHARWHAERACNGWEDNGHHRGAFE